MHKHSWSKHGDCGILLSCETTVVFESSRGVRHCSHCVLVTRDALEKHNASGQGDPSTVQKMLHKAF